MTAVSSLNSQNLSGEELQDALDWRTETRISCFIRPADWKPSWDRAGLEKLVNSAREYYEEETGQSLPYNLAVHGPWVGCPNGYKLYEGDRFNSPSAEAMIEVAARISSWLRIIADEKYVGLQRILETNLGHGMNARRTKIWVYDLLNCWNSPRTAEKRFWKAYKRSWQILKPFGLAPSWHAIGHAMTSSNVSHRLGKMAFAIAANTVNQFCGGGLTGSSVEILTKARGIKTLKDCSNREDRLKYGFWAVSRIEDGEFSCFRDAFLTTVVRFADFENRTIVDLWRVKKHFGHMTEIPLAFEEGRNSSYFVFDGKTIRDDSPKAAWQKFMAAKVLDRRYGQESIDIEMLNAGYGLAENNHAGIRTTVRDYLNKKLVRGGYGMHLPIKCFKGLKKNPVRDQVQVWAFDRIFGTGKFHNNGEYFEAGEFKNYEEAIKASTRLEPDYSDGVELYLDPQTSKTIHRVRCTLGWDEKGNRQFLCQQIGTGRTYHLSLFAREWIEDSHYRDAVKTAIRAWRKQAKLEKANVDLVSFLRGDWGFCPLIYHSDSYRAGNCQTGTASWLRSHAWNSRNFIPGEWLIPFLDETRVRSVATALYQSLIKLR